MLRVVRFVPAQHRLFEDEINLAAFAAKTLGFWDLSTLTFDFGQSDEAQVYQREVGAFVGMYVIDLSVMPASQAVTVQLFGNHFTGQVGGSGTVGALTAELHGSPFVAAASTTRRTELFGYRVTTPLFRVVVTNGGGGATDVEIAIMARAC